MYFITLDGSITGTPVFERKEFDVEEEITLPIVFNVPDITVFKLDNFENYQNDYSLIVDDYQETCKLFVENLSPNLFFCTMGLQGTEPYFVRSLTVDEIAFGVVPFYPGSFVTPTEIGIYHNREGVYTPLIVIRQSTPTTPEQIDFSSSVKYMVSIDNEEFKEHFDSNYTVDKDLENGLHTIKVYSVDLYNNKSKIFEKKFEIKIDKAEKPSIYSETINNEAEYIYLKPVKNIKNMLLYINNQKEKQYIFNDFKIPKISTSGFSLENILKPGVNKISVYYKDKYENISDEVSFNYVFEKINILNNKKINFKEKDGFLTLEWFDYKKIYSISLISENLELNNFATTSKCFYEMPDKLVSGQELTFIITVRDFDYDPIFNINGTYTYNLQSKNDISINKKIENNNVNIELIGG